MQKNLGFIKLIGLLVILSIVAGIFYYLGVRKILKPLPESVTAPAVTEKPNENLATYSNSTYAFSFEHPKNITFNKDIYIAGENEATSLKAGTSIPLEIESVSETGTPDHLVTLFVPVLDFSLSVLKKPTTYKNFSEYVQSEIKNYREAGEESAAGIFVGDANPETINGNTAITFSIQDGSASGNTTLLYYFEKNNYIYAISYFYSRTAFETGYGDRDAKADEVKKVEAMQKMIASFKTP